MGQPQPPKNGVATASRRDVARQREILRGGHKARTLSAMEPRQQQGKRPALTVVPQPAKDVGVAVKRDGKWYQLVTIRRVGSETKEHPGRRTDNKLVAAEWLAAALLESNL